MTYPENQTHHPDLTICPRALRDPWPVGRHELPPSISRQLRHEFSVRAAVEWNTVVPPHAPVFGPVVQRLLICREARPLRRDIGDQDLVRPSVWIDHHYVGVAGCAVRIGQAP